MLEVNAQKNAPKASTLPEAQARTLKGGESFTAKIPGVLVFFPSPDDWAENSDGYKSLFGKHYGPLMNGEMQLIAGGEPLSGSLSIYRKIPKTKAEREAIKAKRAAGATVETPAPTA